MLEGKCIVLGVCGGIAAYKAADLASRLVKQGAQVHVIMTKSGAEFVTPLTFQSITKNPVVCGMFDKPVYWEIEHIALATKADAFIIAPATANIIGKVAGGIADDMLSTTVMATKAPVIFAPAMNDGMYENLVVQENIQKLRERGYLFVDPEEGRLACGTSGKGRLAPAEAIMEKLIDSVCFEKDMKGLRVLVTAGPTREYMDPVRFISNPSSGKMGYAIARAAKRRGAAVTLVSGPVGLGPVEDVEMVYVQSALEMYEAVMARRENADIIVKAAAVGDFRPVDFSVHKMKKEDVPMIQLTKNPDILQEVCAKKTHGVVIGFCMETRDLVRQAYEKLLKKGADFIVANNVAEENSGFATDNNTVCIIGRDGYCDQLQSMPKSELADIILDKALDIYE